MNENPRSDRRRRGPGDRKGPGPVNAFERSLPHSEESERAVLAAILLAPHVMPLVTARLVAEDYYLERHQLIYQAMLELQDKGDEIDLRTLQAQLELKNAFEASGGLAYLSGL
ncbi:MAG: DnaB-like helicase N-terminal domain-containing protein, partial [Acidobacteriota bacterium]